MKYDRVLRISKQNIYEVSNYVTLYKKWYLEDPNNYREPIKVYDRSIKIPDKYLEVLITSNIDEATFFNKKDQLIYLDIIQNKLIDLLHLPINLDIIEYSYIGGITINTLKAVED